MSTESIRAALLAAHEIGQRKALDAVLSRLGRSIVETLFPNVTKAAEPVPPPRPWPDPHAALLLAQLSHVLHSVRHHQDYRPGLRALHALWPDPHAFAAVARGTPAHVQKDYRPAFLKAAHRAPRGGITLTNRETNETRFYSGGKWIPSQDIENATPDTRAKLEAAAAAPPTDSQPQAEVPSRDTSRAHVAAIAKDILTNPGERTPDKYRDLVEAAISAFENGHLSLMDLSALELRMSAALIDGQHAPEAHRTIGVLLSYAGRAIKTMEGQPPPGVQPPSVQPPSVQQPDQPLFSPNEPPSAEAATPDEPEPTLGEEEPALAAGPPPPGTSAVVPTDSLALDPARFQFKMQVNAEGVTKELDKVQKFDPELAGVIAVWSEPETGKVWVVNGHHRYNLAKRLGYPNLAVIYLDAKDAREARAKGALINIAEGRGTALDAAKFLRDSGKTPADLYKLGVSPDGALMRDADTLTRLNDAAFDRLARGGLDQETALAVARHVSDPVRQEKLFKLIDRQRAAGRDFTRRHLEEMARQMDAAPAAQVSSGGLFDDEPSEEDTFLERSDLAAHVRSELSKEHGDYHKLSSKRRAEATKDAGNVLNIDENAHRAAEAEVHKHAFDTLAYRKGAIADVLDAGAVAMKQARTKKEQDNVRKRTLAAVRSALAGAVSGRGPKADGPGVGAVGNGGVAAGGTEPPAGAVKNPADTGGVGAGAGGLSTPPPRSAAQENPAAVAEPSRASATSPALAGAPKPSSPNATWMPGGGLQHKPNVTETPATVAEAMRFLPTTKFPPQNNGESSHEGAAFAEQQAKKRAAGEEEPPASRLDPHPPDEAADFAEPPHPNVIEDKPIPEDDPDLEKRRGTTIRLGRAASGRPDARTHGRAAQLEREQERYAQREAAKITGDRAEAGAVARARTKGSGKHPKEEPIPAPRGLPRGLDTSRSPDDEPFSPNVTETPKTVADVMANPADVGTPAADVFDPPVPAEAGGEEPPAPAADESDARTSPRPEQREAKESDFAAGTVHRQVLSGATAKMTNGWTLKPVRVQGEKRIELVGPLGMHRQQLEEDGVKTEKIAYQLRYFIPVGEEGEQVLNRVMRSRNAPVAEVIPPSRSE